MAGKPKAPVERVAIILSVGVTVALLMMTAVALYATIHHDMDPPRLVAITQVLTGWGGGIIGVLGAYVGYSLRGKDDDQLTQSRNTGTP